VKLELQREQRTGTEAPGSSILGSLMVDGLFECFTLEREGVEIPPGEYPIELTFSPHFQRELPLLDNVPGRTAIRIHPGNMPSDSEGCILVGQSHANGEVFQSRAAFDALIAKVRDSLSRKEPVSISVSESQS